MIIYRNHMAEAATLIAESSDEGEKLCVDKQGEFLVCDDNGETLYEIGWNAALEIAEMWGADPEVIDQYFGDESGAMCMLE